jgi:hypothetical protein
MFKSASGIAFHLESGCHQISRHEVTAAVNAMEISPNISSKPMLIEASPTQALDTVAVPSFIFALPSSFNGRIYQCHICYKTFRNLYSLTGHLNSPAHDENEFRCPKCIGSLSSFPGLSSTSRAERVVWRSTRRSKGTLTT